LVPDDVSKITWPLHNDHRYLDGVAGLKFQAEITRLLAPDTSSTTVLSFATADLAENGIRHGKRHRTT
jgi:hypothetical protein